MDGNNKNTKKVCPNVFKRIIKGCDCFGTFISFRINEDLEYKSLIGGSSTIIFVTFAVIYILYMAYGFLTRSSVNFIFSNKVVESDPVVNLTESKVTLAFGTQYPEDSLGDTITDLEDYIEFKVEIIEWVGEDDITRTKVNLKRCTPEDFFNKVDESFELNDLDYMLCFDMEDKSFVTVEGLYMDYYYKFFKIEVLLTDYAMQKFDEIEEKLKESPIEMAFYFLDSAIDYENRKNPIPSYINYSIKSLDLAYVKTTEIFFSSLEFKNDDNLVFNNEKMIRSITLDYSLDSFKLMENRSNENSGNEVENGDILVKDENKRLLGQFIIKASPKIIQLNRSYQKFPSFLADLTSILEEILILMLLAVNFFERKAVDHKLIERMLKYKGSKYYDIDYLISKFEKDKINSNLASILERKDLQLERKKNVVSKRKSVMILLNNKEKKSDASKKKIKLVNEKNNSININDILESEIDDKRSSEYIKEIEGEISKDKVKTVRSQELLNQSLNSIQNINEKVKYGEKEKYILTSINNQLNQNIEIQSEVDSTVKNDSIFLVKRENMNENNKNKSLSKIKEESEDTQLKKNEIYKNLNLCQIVYASLCFYCSKKQKFRHEVITNAESKIHYYLDIYTYIKKMQEIDLLKYCFFDDDQIELLEFLSKPPIKISEGGIGIYREFEKHQVEKKKIGKTEIDRLFGCYNNIGNKKEMRFEDIKLMRLVKAEIEFLK